ncbi:6-bladed beta-propeller protein [Anseongella ginsenosidimutans]|uniref:6-bladed beta-propeller protein n=1 Tax=Anseongella ginsenosidimutans TaxID=496056 RepID=A0A4R3KN07_9SPHI|nr:6-bladed beta-propeller [Anseongella ginsenosidimutans]QEC52442.1 6-bladed beta-propeller [Anseongella ginsenosidimutans]TCS85807.1 6-bladed beta-propeller protein [Anseongella ginsenosidimutans]
MRKHVYFLLILSFLFITGCKPEKAGHQSADESELVTIKIPDSYQSRKDFDFDDYFSKAAYIPLETTEESFVDGINRLALYKGKIYILSKGSNSVLIFDERGKFLNRVRREGRGPGEYQSLMDFAIDKKGQRLVLYSDRPYLFIYCDLDGEYLNHIPFNNLAFRIGYINGKVQLLVNEKVNLLTEISEGSLEQRTLLNTSATDVFFNNRRIEQPALTTASKLNLLMFYSDTVYTYDGKKLSASFFLDFGDKDFRLEPEFKNMGFLEIYQEVFIRRLGFPVYNFREMEDYVVFSFGTIGNLVLYHKSTGKTSKHRKFEKEGDPMWFSNYFAHDGDDNSIFTIYDAPSFMKRAAEAVEDGKVLPEDVKAVLGNLSELDNPVLLRYTFK